MSNPAVGSLYKRIMEQVIEMSRTDFEENGVDNRMVATLQEKWQKHLTSKRSASFPWDPATQAEPQSEPAAPPAKAQPSAGTSAAPAVSPAQPQAQPQAQAQSQQTSPVNIKQEPGHDAAFGNYPNANNASYSSNPDVAAQRAQHLVQARYQQNQSQQQQQQQGMNLGNIQLPGQQAAQQRPGYTYQNQSYPQQRPGQSASSQQQNGNIKQESQDSVGPGQLDGASDDHAAGARQWSAVMAHRRTAEADGDHGRLAVDRMIRRHVAAGMQRMEAGGLLVPLEERYGHQSRLELTTQKSARAPSHPGLPRFDGGDEDDEDDFKTKPERHEDDINSDLDDDDDDEGDAMIGEDYEGDMIICLYDKVQRVKNKWKCTLKDGVASVNGKDYVFHKGSGEFEWV